MACTTFAVHRYSKYPTCFRFHQMTPIKYCTHVLLLLVTLYALVFFVKLGYGSVFGNTVAKNQQFYH